MNLINNNPIRLASADYLAAAKRLGVDVAVIRAIDIVETGGRSGFTEAGRLRCLYEPHLFHRLTQGRYSAGHPDLSYPHWRRGHYGTQADIVARIEAAASLDSEAALGATSWGRFQVLGLHHRRLGYDTAGDLVEAFRRSEACHLDGFVAFSEGVDGLVAAMRGHDWAGIALRYNGSGYRAHDYDGRLAAAWRRYCDRDDRQPGDLAIGDHGPAVKRLQQALARAGIAINPDGDLGPLTRGALVAFQARIGLPETGIADAATRAALKLA
ncbi:MAG: DUF3380 domain-containing protein [Azospirillum sp.]|nr:DUF3380 domain-containing protein [Azospirillum sp.]